MGAVMPSFSCMERYQGEDIEFTLKFRKGDSPDINSFADFYEIMAYIYTDGCVTAKFSTDSRKHYGRLSRLDDYTLSGMLGSKYTKLFAPGALKIEINVVLGDGTTNLINTGPCGVIIKKDLIKTES
jgi:hypothetical protein